MTSANGNLRLKRFTELLNFFEAYSVLTEQILSAVDEENIDLLNRYAELRQQTQIRIDKLQAANPDLLAISFDDEADLEIKRIRAHIKALAERCIAKEEGLPEKLEALRLKTKQTLGSLAQGQKMAKGYGGYKMAKKGRFVESAE